MIFFFILPILLVVHPLKCVCWVLAAILNVSVKVITLNVYVLVATLNVAILVATLYMPFLVATLTPWVTDIYFLWFYIIRYFKTIVCNKKC